MLTTLVNEGLVFTGTDGRFFFGDFAHDVPMRLIVSSEGYEERTIDRLITRPAAGNCGSGRPRRTSNRGAA
jgi:hypothetical protein